MSPGYARQKRWRKRHPAQYRVLNNAYSRVRYYRAKQRESVTVELQKLKKAKEKARLQREKKREARKSEVSD